MNDEISQKKWAQESGLKYGKDTWLSDILKAQVSDFKPQILFIEDVFYVPGNVIDQWKKEIDSIQLCVGYDGIGVNNPKIFSGYDLILCLLDSSVECYRTAGMQAIKIRAGFETSLLERVDTTKPREAVAIFAGSLFLNRNEHQTRLKVLNKLAREIPIELWVPQLDQFNELSWKGRLRNLLMSPGNYSAMAALAQKNRGRIFGLDLFQRLANVSIVINVHIDSATNAANMRLYESTGMGAVLVTDKKPGIEKLFSADEEILIFDRPEACIKIVENLLTNRDLSDRIGKAGQRRTIKDYSFKDMVLQAADSMLPMLT